MARAASKIPLGIAPKSPLRTASVLSHVGLSNLNSSGPEPDG